MNKQYRRGRQLEYERQKYWESSNHSVTRSSGSHGIWDLTAVDLLDQDAPVKLIQCKLVKTINEAYNMLKSFRRQPPLEPSPHYELILEIKVKGSTNIMSEKV